MAALPMLLYLANLATNECQIYYIEIKTLIFIY